MEEDIEFDGDDFRSKVAAICGISMDEVLLAGDDEVPPENPPPGEKADGPRIPTISEGSEDKTPAKEEEKEHSVVPAAPAKGTTREKRLCSDDLPTKPSRTGWRRLTSSWLHCRPMRHGPNWKNAVCLGRGGNQDMRKNPRTNQQTYRVPA